jgi:hypothetical protein
MRPKQYLYSFSSDSADYYPSGTPTRISCNIPEQIVIATDEQAYISVRSATIPNRFPQINYSNNDFIIRNITTGVNHSVAFVEGTYSASQLASSIQLRLDVALGLGSIDIKYRTTTGTFVFENETGNDYSIVTTLENHEIFGLNIGENYISAHQIVITNVCVVNDSFILNLHTNLNITHSSSNKNKGRTSIIEKFPTPANTYNSTNYYFNNNSTYMSKINERALSKVDLWFEDKYGKEPIFNDVEPWEVSILIEIIKVK